MMASRLFLLFLIASLGGLGTGCAFLESAKERYVACSYHTIWEASLATLGEHPLAKADREKGLIETDWVEVSVEGRPYGLFDREGLGEKERFRTLVTLTRRNEVTVVRLSERREHWGFRGGGRIYQWYPVDASPATLDRLMTTLTEPLEKRGCVIAS